MGLTLTTWTLNATPTITKWFDSLIAHTVSRSNLLGTAFAFATFLRGEMNRKEILNGWHQMLSDLMMDHDDHGDLIGIFLLHIDCWKWSHRSHGPAFANVLVDEVTQRLKHVCDPLGAKVYPMAPDEFLLIYRGKNVRDIYEFSEQIMHQFHPPFGLDGSNYRISVSCGISLYPEHSRFLTMLIRQADIALTRAKKRGNQYILYHPEMK